METGKKKTRIFVNTFSQVVGRFFMVVVSLLVTAFLTRNLGISSYGDYVFITSFIMLFVGLSDLGTTVIGVRESVGRPGQAQIVFNSILFLRLLVTILLLVLINLLVWVVPQFSNLRLEGFIASLVLPCLVLRTTSQAVFQINLRLDLSAFLESFSSILLLLMLSTFYLLNFNWHFIPFSLLFVMAFWTLSALFSGLAGLILSSRYLKWGFIFNKSEAKRILKEAIPLGLFFLAFSVYDRGIDSFLIKSFLGSQALGYYGLAYKIHGNLLLGAAFLMNSLFPIISSLKDDLVKLKIFLKKTFTLLLFVGFIVFLLGFLFAPLIINLIAGKDFSPSVLILRILLVATFLSYVNHLTGYSMIALGNQKKLLYFSIIGLLINLIINVIFIPIFSYYAAAVATIITEGTLFVLTLNFLVTNHSFSYKLSDFIYNAKDFLVNKEKFFEI